MKKFNRPIPAFEIEYLDEGLRIQRTSEGYTFIIKKTTSVNNISNGGVGGVGLGPWLKDKIGENGMKNLGILSLTPYLLFAITGIREYLESR